MKFWWVSQNQTFDHEVPGGYMWSPKVNRDESQNHFYETMREVAGVEKALLKYCELDTLAMVMLWEEWQDQLQNVSRTAQSRKKQRPITAV